MRLYRCRQRRQHGAQHLQAYSVPLLLFPNGFYHVQLTLRRANSVQSLIYPVRRDKITDIEKTGMENMAAVSEATKSFAEDIARAASGFLTGIADSIKETKTKK